MSITIDIIGGHTLDFSSKEMLIADLKESLGERFLLFEKKEEYSYKRDSYFKVAFASTFFVLTTVPKIGEYDPVRIFTNHFICDQIEIYEKTCIFHFRNINRKFFHWTEVYFSKDKNSPIDYNMKLLREFMKDFLQLVGGDYVLYLNDSQFPNAMGMAWEGFSIEEIRNACEENNPAFTEYADYTEKKHVWYIDELNIES